MTSSPGLTRALCTQCRCQLDFHWLLSSQPLCVGVLWPMPSASGSGMMFDLVSVCLSLSLSLSVLSRLLHRMSCTNMSAWLHVRLHMITSSVACVFVPAIVQIDASPDGYELRFLALENEHPVRTYLQW